MDDTSRRSMQYSRDCYPRFNSSESVSVYHDTGYLSPPYSISRRSTADTTFPASTNGLGIATCHSYTPQPDQTYHIPSIEPPTFLDNSQHRIAAVQRVPSPRQHRASPVYGGTLLPRTTHEDRRLSIHHSSPMLVASGNESYYSQHGYDLHSRDMQRCTEPNNFGYQPDPMQEGKWVATSHDLLAIPEASVQHAIWQSDYSQHYPYQVNYSNMEDSGLHYQHTSSNDSFALQGSHIVGISTPPASHEGSPEQDTKISFGTTQFPSKPYDINKSPHDTPSPAVIVKTEPDSRMTTKLSGRSGKRLLGRAAKSDNPRPSLQCKHCPKTFAKRSKLREHESCHEKTIVVCPEPHCKKIYGRHADLARHQRSHHKGHLFPCKYCLKIFNRSDITRRHEEHSCRQRRAEQAMLGPTHQNIKTR